MKPAFRRMLALVGLAALVQACAGGTERIKLDLQGVVFTVEVARSPAERERGLMERKDLDQRGGMLFVFERDQRVAFWMRNTYVPLSVAYIDSQGVVREIHDLQPQSLRPVESEGSVRYALELLQGTFGRLGIEPGYRIDLSALPAQRGQ